jgi:hypothetical protein
MLCYFFCTQEIFGSVAPDIQTGVQVSVGIRDIRFYLTYIRAKKLLMCTKEGQARWYLEPELLLTTR